MTRPLEHPLTPGIGFATAATLDDLANDFPQDFDIGEAMSSQLLPSRRGDGWTADRQRAFCDAVATGRTVESAARAVGLSASSAYAFRNSAKGAAFGIGWMAASLIQRQRLADIVAARAFDGQTITVTRGSGETVERHFYDNRLAMSVLTRLDRLAAGAAGTRTDSHDPVGLAQAQDHAARLAAGEWDRYLDLLANDATPARAGLFLAQRTADRATPGSPELAAIAALARADLYDRTRAGVPAELDIADLDIAHRAEWSASQWARAEAAGLLLLAGPVANAGNADGSPQHSQHSPAAPEDADEDSEVWWCARVDAWRTNFPPPDDFYGEQEGEFGDENYERELTDEEEKIMEAPREREIARRFTVETVERDAWFAAYAELVTEEAAGKES